MSVVTFKERAVSLVHFKNVAVSLVSLEGPSTVLMLCLLYADDPEERRNIIEEFPQVAEALEEKLKVYVEEMVPAYLLDDSVDADPDNFGGFWSYGWCDQ